jgi:cell division initiation protein
MDVSPQLLREVEFREQWRGYNPDEVDDFLERLALALEELQARLRDTDERAAAAERRLLDASGDDDELRRTLVLARRTADAAIEEARAEAGAIVAEAEGRAGELRAEAERHAEAVRSDAERHAEVVRAEADARAEAELGELAERRRQLDSDADALGAYVDEQRHRIHQELREQLAWIEQPGRLTMPPRPVEPLEAEPRERPRPDELHATAGEPAEPGGDPGASAGEDTGPHPVVVAPDPDPGEPTGLFDALADDDGGTDDPFLAELRRAVTDTEPLGPRESRTDWDRDDEDDDRSPGRFRRRRG